MLRSRNLPFLSIFKSRQQGLVAQLNRSIQAVSCEGVLFDFDGVIADTMQANLRAWQLAFHDFGVHIRPDDYFSLEGMSPDDVASALAEKHGLDRSIAEKTPALKEAYFLGAEACPLFPGVLDLLSCLRSQGKACALVTGASKERLDATLSPEVLAMLDFCVTAGATLKGKPAPDPFLSAAHQLGLTPSECVVVENAPLGILSAKRAGMKCIAVCSTLKPELLRDADFIVADLAQVGCLLLSP